VVKNVAILDLSEAISRKWCKIGGKLLLITNRKSHKGFRLVPNSVTLNDLERRNRPNGWVISPNLVAFWADCIKVVEDIRILSAEKCRPNNVGLTIYYLWRYWQGIIPSDSASENLTNNQP